MDQPEPEELVQQFWRIQSGKIQPDSRSSSPIDQCFIQIMKDSIFFNGERFEIKLPRKENSNLKNNYFFFLSQLKNLIKRLERNPQLPDNCCRTQQTVLEKTTLNQLRCKMHLGIESVISHITQLRILTSPARFGGSQMQFLISSEKHKNIKLLTGPFLLNSLLGVLMLFREYPIAVLPDIEGTFLQIAINQTDRSALRFLWINDNEIQQYQFTRQIFGATCSPSCAIFLLNPCADKNGDEYPEAVKAVKNHFYMYDYVQLHDTVTNASKTFQQTIQNLREESFRLTKFGSNEPDVLKNNTNTGH